MKLGDKVRCTGHIKKSGKHYEIDQISCFFWEKRAKDGLLVDGCHSCDRYIVKEIAFGGIFVGVTTLCTRLNVDWNDGPCPGHRAYNDKPEKFAVVYFADNKRRLVPLDKIEVAP